MARLRPADNRPLSQLLIEGLLLLASVSLFAELAVAGGDPQRGRAVFAMAGGCGCHTGPDGMVGAGGGEVPTPFGTFYGTNITPDIETGIGSWTDEEIAAAIRNGQLRDGSIESPAMPYYRYAAMADTDLVDLIAYLRSLPAVRRPDRAHETWLPRAAYRAWRLLFVRAGEPPRQRPEDQVARGRYLLDHVAICGDCHTPRNRWGAEDRSRYLAGTFRGPGGARVPNITPHATGIAHWDEADIVSLLSLGMLPTFDNVQGLMAEVVDGKAGAPGYKDAPKEDHEAIAAYLKVVPPIDNDVPRRGR